MKDDVFIQRVKEKIERLTDKEIDLAMDSDNPARLDIELADSQPRIVVGSDVLEYAGFARLAIEYAVASIRRGTQISRLEFQVLLSRN